jgi:hypothetical protein
MGFQSSDLRTFTPHLYELPGVTDVWALAASEHDATVWIVVHGFDQEAHANRIRVRQEVERFLSKHREDMKESGFVYDYHVLVGDEEVGDPQIPVGARRVAA